MLCCPECLVRKRRPAQLVAEAVPAPVAATAMAAPPKQRQSLKWLDVHCHVFNLADLPVAEFVEKTRLSGLAIAAAPIVWLIANFFKEQAVSADDELWQLHGHPAAIASARLSTRDALDAMRTQAQNRLPPMRNPDSLMHDALKEYDPKHDTTQPISDEQLNTLAEALDGDDAIQDNDYLEWITLLTKSRNDIVNLLLAQFPTGDDVMITPSMVDYNRWLGLDSTDDQSLTSQPKQLALMQAITQRHALPVPPQGERRALLSFFVPFDPWRSIEDANVLVNLRAWIASGQAIGVKIYPPMGFAALGNADLPDDAFPDALADLVRAKGLPSGVGAALDQEMRKLFQLCEDLDVPLMAHVADSETIGGVMLKLPGPDYWAKALKEFPKLRVNLGHFGGVWRFADPSTDPVAITYRHEAEAWATGIVGLMGQYPNVYADFAFFDQALEQIKPGNQASQAVGFIATMAAASPVLKQRLMFGSDWIMVGMLSAASDYAQRVMTSMNYFFGDPGVRENLRWRNAARYLGLSPGDRTHTRIRANLGTNVDLLARFDPS